MKERRIEVSVKELNTLIKSGQRLQTTAKKGTVYLEFSGRGPTPQWAYDLAKMRGVKELDSKRLRGRIGKVTSRRTASRDTSATTRQMNA